MTICFGASFTWYLKHQLFENCNPYSS